MKIETWYSPDEGCRVLDVDALLDAMGVDHGTVDEVALEASPLGFTLTTRMRPDAQKVNVKIVTTLRS
jgi:hypothetical protein